MLCTKGGAERARIERFDSAVKKWCIDNQIFLTDLLKESEIDNKNYAKWVKGKPTVGDRKRMKLEQITGIKY